MDASNLNQQLREAYEPYLETVYNQKWNDTDNLSAPLLMHMFEEYEHAAKKILVVGQETHGWSQMKVQPNAEVLLSYYVAFNLGKSADYGDSKPLRYLRSPFWNFSRSFFYDLNKSVSGITRKTNGFLLTNLSKFDSNTTAPSFELQKQNAAGFELLKKEISIVKPDVIVFLTGTKYNYWLDELFSFQKEVIIENDLLWLLKSSDQSLPQLIFQTQHPRTLCMQKAYRTVLNKIIQLTID